jgi:hypothetical protein
MARQATASVPLRLTRLDALLDALQPDDVSKLHQSHSILQRILYKNKNQHRVGAYYHKLCELQRCIKLWNKCPIVDVSALRAVLQQLDQLQTTHSGATVTQVASDDIGFLVLSSKHTKSSDVSPLFPACSCGWGNGDLDRHNLPHARHVLHSASELLNQLQAQSSVHHSGASSKKSKSKNKSKNKDKDKRKNSRKSASTGAGIGCVGSALCRLVALSWILQACMKACIKAWRWLTALIAHSFFMRFALSCLSVISDLFFRYERMLSAISGVLREFTGVFRQFAESLSLCTCDWILESTSTWLGPVIERATAAAAPNRSTSVVDSDNPVRLDRTDQQQNYQRRRAQDRVNGATAASRRAKAISIATAQATSLTSIYAELSSFRGAVVAAPESDSDFEDDDAKGSANIEQAQECSVAQNTAQFVEPSENTDSFSLLRQKPATSTSKSKSKSVQMKRKRVLNKPAHAQRITAEPIQTQSHVPIKRRKMEMSSKQHKKSKRGKSQKKSNNNGAKVAKTHSVKLKSTKKSQLALSKAAEIDDIFGAF